MLHDEKVYGPDVGSFNPERFLKDGELNFEVKSPDVAFGFGRRVCPGRHLVADSLFITIASVLATFDISKAVDEKGNFITPVEEYTSGVIR
jgi:cytochrome P450